MMREILNKIFNLFTRGKITLTDDSGDIQKLQVSMLSGEIKDGVERIQEYGLASSLPENDSDVMMVSLAGNRDHSVIIKAGSRKFRMKDLKNGEVALYTDEDDMIHFKRGSIIDFNTKTLNINATDTVNIVTKNFNIDCTDFKATATGSAEFTTPELKASAKLDVGADAAIGGKADITGPATALAGVFAAGYNGPTGGAPIAMTGDVVVTGEISDNNGTMADIKTKYNTHNHGSNPATTPTPQM
jgi:phage baseplate assembly protein V